jgi:hypothetical protein
MHQHSMMSGLSCCPKDDAFRTAHAGREREHIQNNREVKTE